MVPADAGWISALPIRLAAFGRRSRATATGPETGGGVTFSTILAQVAWLLLCERAVTYRRIVREFDLDGAALEDVRHELIQIKRCAVDRDGEFLVWAGTTVDVVSMSYAPLHEALPAVRRCALTQSPAEVGLPPLAETVAPLPSSDAERRPLTVMFCDLADSTALSTRLDPEDLQDVIRPIRKPAPGSSRTTRATSPNTWATASWSISATRNRWSATPSGRCAAALGIVAAMAELNRTLGRDKGIEIAVRIGIATGMVMVGEVVGEGMAQERAVIGEAPNMAARLQGLAGRNGIVIGALTKELAGDAFVYRGPRRA